MADIDAMVATNGHTNEATEAIKDANVEVLETENKFQQAIAAWRSAQFCPLRI